MVSVIHNLDRVTTYKHIFCKIFPASRILSKGVSHLGNQLIKVPLMEPEVQVCPSQEAATSLYQEPDEFRPHSHIQLF